MIVHLFRHGESVSNAGGRTNDPALIALTPLGEAQSRALANTLRSQPDLLLVSTFLRSAETARPIADRFPDVKVEVWPIQEFTYLSPAACVGTSWIERKPWIDDYWETLDPDKVDGPGAENFNALLGRASAFLDRLTRLEARHVVAVSHGQFMQAAKLMAEQPELQGKAAMREFVQRQTESPFPNCASLVLHQREGRMAVIR